jgi:caffeoyl-CoA O-methyltransferase
MAGIVSSDIETYARDHSVAEDALFAELTRETQEKGTYPAMQSGHVEGTLLRLLVELVGAKRVLEIGTFTGYSALTMAAGLPDDGELFTCDVDPDMTAIAQRYWERSPHGKKISLRLGPALETIETLDGPFDLVFIDADKENYLNYWNAIMEKVHRGGLLVADNVLWSGKVLDPKEPSDHAIVAFNKAVREDERVSPLMLTIRDGVTIARKR